MKAKLITILTLGFLLFQSQLKASKQINLDDLVKIEELKAPKRTIVLWGVFRNLSGVPGGVIWGCTHAPIICTTYEVYEEGPLQQNGTFRATAYNPDGTIASEIEYSEVYVSQEGETTKLKFILP